MMTYCGLLDVKLNISLIVLLSSLSAPPSIAHVDLSEKWDS